MKTKQLIQNTLMLAVLASLGAQAQTQVVKSNWKEGKGVVEFPALSDSYFKNPQIINLNELNLIDAMDNGMNKEQVWRLIGRPHFKEGAFGVRVWNYAFRFKQADNSYQTCQYQLHFSERPHLVDSMYKTCDGVTPPKAAKMMTLSADALFAFGRSGTNDVSSKGMSEIRQLGTQINQAYSRIDSLQITGHTDYVGSDASNLTLSRARAVTVKQLLVDLGVPAAVISTDGRGEAQPVTTCAPNLAKPALVACLAPNRRVTVQISGEERVVAN